MNTKEQKTELNKKDIYENVREDINRRQTVHSNKSTNYRSGTPEMPDRRKKAYSSYELPQRQQHGKDAYSQPSSLSKAPSWISQHRARPTRSYR